METNNQRMVRYFFIAIIFYISINSLVAQTQLINYGVGKKEYILESSESHFLVKITKKYKEKELLKYFQEILKGKELKTSFIQYIPSLNSIEIKIDKDNNGKLREPNTIKVKNLLRENDLIASIEPFLSYRNIEVGCVMDEILIRLKESKDKEKWIAYLKQFDFTLDVKENLLIPNLLVLYKNKFSSLNLFEVCKQLKALNIFDFVEPNFYHNKGLTTGDPLYSKQWNLKNNGQTSFDSRIITAATPNFVWNWASTTVAGNITGADIKVEDAWLITKGSPEIKVAVIDQFIDYEHPDLKANLLMEYFYDPHNTEELYSNQFDRGRISGHGTSVAGVIGAVQNNSEGISGIAPFCKIIPIAAFVNNGVTTDLHFANAIAWAVLKGADVINNSWALEILPSIIEAEINNATTNGRNGLGCVVTFTTGNYTVGSGGTALYEYEVLGTGRPDNVIAVGATTMCNQRKSTTSCDGETAWASHYGNEIDVVAPSCFIVTTDMAEQYNLYNTTYGYTDLDYNYQFNGTSASCPQVSAVAALVLSVNRCLTWQQVKSIIEHSCDRVGNYCYSNNASHPNGTWNIEMGHGRINAYQAVLRALNKPQLSPSTLINQPKNIANVTIQTGVSLTTNINDNCLTDNHSYTGVDKIEVRRDITFSSMSNPTITATSNGFQSASTITSSGNNWAGVRNITSTSAQVYTYVYFDGTNYYPFHPDDIRFNIYMNDIVGGSAPNTRSLTNQTIASNQDLLALNVIEAGNIASAGNYTINNGTSSFRSGQYVKLVPGFNAQAQTSTHFRAQVNKFVSCTNFSLGKTIDNISVKYNPSNLDIYKTYYSLSTTSSNDLEQFEVPINIKVFPNPAHSFLNISFQESKVDIEITLFDMMGKQMFSTIRNIETDDLIKLDIQNFATGVYLLQVKSNNELVKHKFIID